MSIKSEIQRINNNVQNTLSSIASKGVSVPANANSDNLQELTSLLYDKGIADGFSSGGCIIDVSALPTEDINENAFYRLSGARHLYIDFDGKKEWESTLVLIVDTLLEVGAEGVLYVRKTDLAVYLYGDAGWLDVSSIFTIIYSEEEATSTGNYILLSNTTGIYTYSNSSWLRVDNEPPIEEVAELPSGVTNKIYRAEKVDVYIMDDNGDVIVNNVNGLSASIISVDELPDNPISALDDIFNPTKITLYFLTSTQTVYIYDFPDAPKTWISADMMGFSTQVITSTSEIVEVGIAYLIIREGLFAYSPKTGVYEQLVFASDLDKRIEEIESSSPGGGVSIVQTTGLSETKVMSQKASSNAFANAIKATVSGEVVRVDDVSPVSHNVSVKVSGVADPAAVTVKVRGKNLLNFDAGINSAFIKNEDGSYTLTMGSIRNSNWIPIYLKAGYHYGVLFEVLNSTLTLSPFLQFQHTDGTYSTFPLNEPKLSPSKDISQVRIMLEFGTPESEHITLKGHIEFGDFTAYEPFVSGGEYAVSSDGTVSIPNISPCMTLYTAVDGAIIEAHYNRDTEKAIKKISSSFSYAEYPLPIVYFEGDTAGMSKDNKVTLNYTHGDRSGTCTLKWQGSSSIAFPKKNYTVEFDNAFEAVSGWGVEKKYVLKADWVDFSHCRNVVSAKLWGDVVRSRATSDLVTRLSSLPNCGAVDGFPCFVVINGEWQGIYNFNIPKDGWMMGMGNGTREAILCAEGKSVGGAEDFKTEGTIGEEFSLEYSSDGWAESDIQASLNRLINACINSDGTDIDTIISQYVDIDSAIDYLIFSQLLSHHDGIHKNYILATYDGVKWFFSAYDMDNVFGQHYPGNIFDAANAERVDWQLHTLFNLLYEYKFDKVRDRYNQLIETVMPLATVDAKFTNYALSIPLPAYNADAELWKTIPSTAINNIEQIKNWYGDRIEYLDETMGRGSKGLSYSGKECTGMGSCMDVNIDITYPISTIATNAFKGETIIESVNLQRLTQIKAFAFQNCTSLKSFIVSSQFISLGWQSFGGCTALKSVQLNNARDVNLIGYAFSDCINLEKVSLPSQIRTIEESVFRGCTSLKDIFYAGTMAEWGAITKGADWDYNTGTYTIHCTDGDIAKA